MPECVGPRDPAGDLVARVGASERAPARRPASVAAAGRDRARRRPRQLGQRLDRHPPCLVVGQVEVEVRQLAPGGDVDQAVDDLRLEPLPGEVDVQTAERGSEGASATVARDGRPARQPLGERHEAVHEAARRQRRRRSIASPSIVQAIRLGRELGVERGRRRRRRRCRRRRRVPDPPIEVGDRVPRRRARRRARSRTMPTCSSGWPSIDSSARAGIRDERQLVRLVGRAVCATSGEAASHRSHRAAAHRLDGDRRRSSRRGG